MARAGSLLFVVAGHLVLAVIDKGPHGGVRGTNLVALEPGLSWLGLASPMPVFFVAAGWAAASSSRSQRSAADGARSRVRVLVLLACVVTALWGTVAVVEQLVTRKRGVLTDGARLATQPLWFLAAYVPFALAGRLTARAAHRPLLWLLASIALVGVSDSVRFGCGAPRWVGFAGFFVAWSVPWVAGWWWQDNRGMRGTREARAGVVLFTAGAASCVVLVRWFGYSGTLIDAVSGRRSNSTPPTLFTVGAAVSQAGGLMVCARLLDVAAARCRPVVSAFNRVAPGFYAWHLSGLALASLPLALGAPFPRRFTIEWWLLRPVWAAAVITITWLLVKVTMDGRANVPAAPTARPPGKVSAAVAAALVALGAAAVGLWGPTTPLRATSECAALIAGLLLL